MVKHSIIGHELAVGRSPQRQSWHVQVKAVQRCADVVCLVGFTHRIADVCPQQDVVITGHDRRESHVRQRLGVAAADRNVGEMLHRPDPRVSQIEGRIEREIQIVVPDAACDRGPVVLNRISQVEANIGAKRGFGQIHGADHQIGRRHQRDHDRRSIACRIVPLGISFEFGSRGIGEDEHVHIAGETAGQFEHLRVGVSLADIQRGRRFEEAQVGVEVRVKHRIEGQIHAVVPEPTCCIRQPVIAHRPTDRDGLAAVGGRRHSDVGDNDVRHGTQRDVQCSRSFGRIVVLVGAFENSPEDIRHCKYMERARNLR